MEYIFQAHGQSSDTTSSGQRPFMPSERTCLLFAISFSKLAFPWIVSSARSSKVVFSSCGAENRPVGWCPLLYSCKRYKLRQIILKVPNSCDKAPTKQGILEPPLTDASLKPYWSCLWKPVNFTFSVFGTSSSAKPWLGCRVY